MKILHLNTLPHGGAATAARRLHIGLLQSGADSTFLSVFGPEDVKNRMFSLEAENAGGSFALRRKKNNRSAYFNSWLVRFYGKPVELFNSPSANWDLEYHPLVKSADIIHLHWVAGMIDVPKFFQHVKQKVVWTLHDAWPFTGGFHYQAYFDTRPFKTLMLRNARTLEKAYSGKKLTIVAPSKYLLEQSKTSGLFAESTFTHIPNGLPTDEYQTEAGKSRGETWFFAAGELDYYRMGADILFDAFTNLNRDVKLVVAGDPCKMKLPHDRRITYLGYVNDQKHMAELFGAASLTINASREDNFPNCLIESLCAGTPVLAPAVGGIPETITHGVNGWLVESPDSNGFLEALRSVGTSVFDHAAISADASARYAVSVQVTRFLELYRGDHL